MTQPFTPPYEGATPEQLNNQNVQQFLYLHNYLRNELKMMLQLIDQLIGKQDLETAEFSPSILQGLVRAGSQYAQHLHAHHHGETYMFFPVLEREGLAKEIIDRLNREHDELSELIDKATVGLVRMKSAEIPQIRDDLRQLGDALRDHLDYEEAHVCPLLAMWSSPAAFYAALFQQ